MRRLWILATALAVNAPASADVTICNEYESGPALAKLAEICDLLGSDPAVNKPLLSPEECQRRFTIMGALWYNSRQQENTLNTQYRAALRAIKLADAAALPLPSPGPTPTPTPTATATATPTATAAP